MCDKTCCVELYCSSVESSMGFGMPRRGPMEHVRMSEFWVTMALGQPPWGSLGNVVE